MDTAQEVYKEKMQKQRREQLIREGMALWDSSAEHFNELPSRYQELLEEKRQKRVAIGRLKAEVINCYPCVELFEIEERGEAEAWLSNMELWRLEKEISSIRSIFEENYSYRTLRDWVKEAEYMVRHPKRSPTLMY